MAILKILAFVLFVGAVILLAGGIVMFGSDQEGVPQVSEDRALSGGLYTLFGVAFFAMGVVLLFMERGQERRAAQAASQEAAAKAAQPQAPKTRQVQIKRTSMDVAPAPAPAAASQTVDPDHAALDEINRKMARLKVQYGMGDVSRESYRHLMEALEREKSEIELRLLDAGSKG